MKQDSPKPASAITNDILVEAVAQHLRDESAEDRFVFSYNIKISNMGREVVQLLDRQWIINDSIGKQMEVKGDGVIGKQPSLEPGMTFEYSSWTMLNSPTGSMKGFYGMIYEKTKQKFIIRIPEFQLVATKALN